MTARNFLLRGLLAGVIAGFFAFAVAYAVGEPSVQRAIDLEESSAAPAVAPPSSAVSAGIITNAALVHTHSGAATHDDDHGSDEGTVVSRHNQRTWGLLTASLAVSTVLGGAVALIVAGVAGRLGQLSVRQSALLVSLIGFIAMGLVPFLKYPANPPAVGSGETIGSRTGSYFGFLLVSLVLAVVATYAAARLRERWGTFNGLTAAVLGYVVLMSVAAIAFPAVNELGDFPADTLWSFRVGSALTIATMWAAIGLGTAALLGRLADHHGAIAARREFAASL